MTTEVYQHAPCKRTPTKMLKHDEEYQFSVDYFRCGKCNVEFNMMEEFVLHKLFVEHCSLMLWDSKRIQGLQIPKFVEHVTDAQSTKAKKENKGYENEKYSESRTTALSSTDITYDLDLQVDDLLTFKQNNRNTETNRESSKQKQNHSWSQQIKKFSSTGNDVDHHTNTDGRNETGYPWNNEKMISHTVIKTQTGHKGLICDQCGNRYKDMVILRTHISTVHTGSRPFHCQQCSDTFKTKGSLVRHIRRHTDERPFHCRHCGRSFRESGALARHLRSRVSCLTKADTDLPRYGKTVILQENECQEKEKLPSTLQIIISRVPETHCDIKTDEVEDHCNTEAIHTEEQIVVDTDTGDDDDDENYDK